MDKKNPGKGGVTPKKGEKTPTKGVGVEGKKESDSEEEENYEEGSSVNDFVQK